MELGQQSNGGFWLKIAARSGLCDRPLTGRFLPAVRRMADIAPQRRLYPQGWPLPAESPTG
jgi:hypothetical protein